MNKSVLFIFVAFSLFSCKEPLEKQVVGNWIDTDFKRYKHTKSGRSEDFVIDTVEMTFLEGRKLVMNNDTTELIFEDNGYLYDATRYKMRQPEDEWYTLRILEISDSSMELEFFWLRDTVNLKIKKLHPNKV